MEWLHLTKDGRGTFGVVEMFVPETDRRELSELVRYASKVMELSELVLYASKVMVHFDDDGMELYSVAV